MSGTGRQLLPLTSLLQEAATEIPVLVKLRSKESQIIEFHLIPYLLHKGKTNVKAIDILIEIEDIGFRYLEFLFDQIAYYLIKCISRAQCRTHANVAHTVQLTAKCLYLNEIDPVSRNEFQRLI